MVADTTALVTPVIEHCLERDIAQWVHHEGSIRRPIAPSATDLPTELHFGTMINKSIYSSGVKQNKLNGLIRLKQVLTQWRAWQCFEWSWIMLFVCFLNIFSQEAEHRSRDSVCVLPHILDVRVGYITVWSVHEFQLLVGQHTVWSGPAFFYSL